MTSSDDRTAGRGPMTAWEVFDPEALMKGAQADLGLSDFGDTPFEDALEILCRSLRDDRPRTASAVRGLGADIRRLLGQRLQLAEARKRHPEIPPQQLRRPLVLLGLPRSGSTILHSLLSADPALRSPLKWELDRPFPPPRSETYHTDPRIKDAEAEVAKLDPQYRAMHQIGAQIPMECNTIQEGSFRSMDFTAFVCIPSYAEWLFHEADMAPAYAYHAEFLQHLQAFTKQERWVLKGPPHMFWPQALLSAYPDACVVMTHRDPGQIIPSTTSFNTHIRRMLEPTEGADIGREQSVWTIAIRRMMALRDSWCAPQQFFDVHYNDFVKYPLEVVQSIYAHFQLPLSSEAEASMRAFMTENRQEKHGKHVYDGADFGLRPEVIRREYAEYIDRFNVQVN